MWLLYANRLLGVAAIFLLGWNVGLRMEPSPTDFGLLQHQFDDSAAQARTLIKIGRREIERLRTISCAADWRLVGPARGPFLIKHAIAHEGLGAVILDRDEWPQ